MKKIAVELLKWGLVILIFVYLFSRSLGTSSLREFCSAEKNWLFITLGFLCSLLPVLITFIRWGWLNTALGVRLSTGETIRLGFIGFVFNFLPMGIVGGDLVKGILLTRKNPTLKAECAASVIVDRVIGLYAMFLVGLGGILFTGFYRNTQSEAVVATQAIYWLSGISTVGMLFLLWPSSGRDGRGRLFRKIPLVGGLLGKVYDACAIYQGKPGVMAISLSATFAVHFLFSLSLWFLSLGLWEHAPSPTNHLVIYPVSNIGSMIPLSAGPMEFFLDQLYPLFPCVGGDPYQLGHGMLVGISYRIATVVIAGIGGIYYLLNRGEIGVALAQAKEENRRKNQGKTENTAIAKEPATDGQPILEEEELRAESEQDHS